MYQSRAFNASRSYSGSVVLQKPYDMASGSFDIVTQTSPLNNRPTAHITLNLSDYKPGKVIAIMVIGEPGTTVHGWANNNYCCFRKWNEKMDLPDNKYQTGEIGGVGKNVITVGAYVTRPFVRTVSGRPSRFFCTKNCPLPGPIWKLCGRPPSPCGTKTTNPLVWRHWSFASPH